ncbi:MAG: RecX family transcriptional regulator [Rothia sp. (in: high G+C Gram-positive bacteria)]|uniref:regulatory protein RecX n=1 Tax=Rothia sp. (in: high G+C Gram-positive bacteria) TaxID=1885016 RepID=UPI0026DF92AF|nr:RecX family transcriptional regulator [Rothia sp. (in: high G+C Gram-positive bacteria)]MDO5750411.1 RecX family transcriptional regulator [Rothia sp. (in: high G+C Gram-positive bacteria)]
MAESGNNQDHWLSSAWEAEETEAPSFLPVDELNISASFAAVEPEEIVPLASYTPDPLLDSAEPEPLSFEPAHIAPIDSVSSDFLLSDSAQAEPVEIFEPVISEPDISEVAESEPVVPEAAGSEPYFYIQEFDFSPPVFDAPFSDDSPADSRVPEEPYAGYEPGFALPESEAPDFAVPDSVEPEEPKSVAPLEPAEDLDSMPAWKRRLRQQQAELGIGAAAQQSAVPIESGSKTPGSKTSAPDKKPAHVSESRPVARAQASQKTRSKTVASKSSVEPAQTTAHKAASENRKAPGTLPSTGEYPAWHPAALGLAEDIPDPENAPARPASSSSDNSSSEQESEESSSPKSTKNTKKRYERRYNPDRKRGFRRFKESEKSPYAPAIGARPAEEKPKSKRASKPLFAEGSSLNEALTPEEEAFIRGLAAEENTAVPGQKRGRQREEIDPYVQARTIVYNQLAYSAKSRQQLRAKLESKGFESDLIEPLLDKFQAANLIDDAQYARDFVAQRGSGKKLSRAALRRELKTRGIVGDMAEEALAQRTDADERADAAELVRKKLRPSMDLEDRTERDKVMRRLVGMLGRRGYSAGIAYSVVKQEVDSFREEHGKA